jgi:hypothetical protein
MNANLKSVSYPEVPKGPRLAAALAAVAISASIFGGLLGLFEWQSESAMFAKAQVPAASTFVVDASKKAQVAGVKNTARG